MRKEDADTLRPRPPQAGMDAVDETTFSTGGGEHEDLHPAGDIGAITENDLDSNVLTSQGDVAVDSGKLPGNEDDFEGEMNAPRHGKPGAGDEANTGTHQKTQQE